MPREDGIDDLRLDGVLVADDAREEWGAGAKPGDQIGAQLLLDAAGTVAGGLELPKGSGT